MKTQLGGLSEGILSNSLSFSALVKGSSIVL